ncbi:hypothetical protein EJ04DRAFT_29479 [Polyplosphaeria fusca]|uniref:Uncharacterized protein n=1 Tax=Polyplosphaeria fusca TaxID=682080 RepID=A0A9P4QNR6_9PLEO|nr:hypothetical protein EJ04DRAFT_29479 [Polyplosphaeria fusca]
MLRGRLVWCLVRVDSFSRRALRGFLWLQQTTTRRKAWFTVQEGRLCQRGADIRDKELIDRKVLLLVRGSLATDAMRLARTHLTPRTLSASVVGGNACRVCLAVHKWAVPSQTTIAFAAARNASGPLSTPCELFCMCMEARTSTTPYLRSSVISPVAASAEFPAEIASSGRQSWRTKSKSAAVQDEHRARVWRTAVIVVATQAVVLLVQEVLW